MHVFIFPSPHGFKWKKGWVAWRTQRVLLELWLVLLSVTPFLQQCLHSAPILPCHSQPCSERENSEEVSHETSRNLDISIPVVSWVDAPCAEHLLCWMCFCPCPEAFHVCVSALLFWWSTAAGKAAVSAFLTCRAAQLC